MNFSEYQVAALHTAKNFGNIANDLTHAALGIATEGGEFTTQVKRMAIYYCGEGGGVDGIIAEFRPKEATPEMIDNMAEELGDLLWYIALAAEHLGVPLNRIAERNVAKLQARYPERYSDAAAEARADKQGGAE